MSPPILLREAGGADVARQVLSGERHVGLSLAKTPGPLLAAVCTSLQGGRCWLWYDAPGVEPALRALLSDPNVLKATGSEAEDLSSALDVRLFLNKPGLFATGHSVKFRLEEISSLPPEERLSTEARLYLAIYQAGRTSPKRLNKPFKRRFNKERDTYLHYLTFFNALLCAQGPLSQSSLLNFAREANVPARSPDLPPARALSCALQTQMLVLDSSGKVSLP